MKIVSIKNAKFIDEEKNVLFSNVNVDIEKGDIVLVIGGNKNLGFLNLCADFIRSLTGGEVLFYGKAVLLSNSFKYFNSFKVKDFLKTLVKESGKKVLNSEIDEFLKINAIENVKIKNLSNYRKNLLFLYAGYLGGFSVVNLGEDFFSEENLNNFKITEFILRISSEHAFVYSGRNDDYEKIVNKVVIFDEKNIFKECIDLKTFKVKEIKLDRNVNLKNFYCSNKKCIVPIEKFDEFEEKLKNTGINIKETSERKATLKDIAKLKGLKGF